MKSKVIGYLLLFFSLFALPYLFAGPVPQSPIPSLGYYTGISNFYPAIAKHSLCAAGILGGIGTKNFIHKNHYQHLSDRSKNRIKGFSFLSLSSVLGLIGYEGLKTMIPILKAKSGNYIGELSSVEILGTLMTGLSLYGSIHYGEKAYDSFTQKPFPLNK